MVEGENNEVNVSETTRKKQNDEDGINVNYWSLWEEINNFTAYFNLNDFATGVVFDLIPSVYDMGSDFALALEWSKELGMEPFAAITYLFLSSPGMMLGLKSLYNRVLRRCCTCSFADHCICKLVGYIIVMALCGSMIFGIRLIGMARDADTCLFATAIMTSIFILSTKLLRVLVHGPEMKKLSAKMSSVEAQHDSTLQLWLIAFLGIRGIVKLETTEIMSIISSFVMIAKSGAESLLTFGATNKLKDKGFWKKMKLLLSLIPVLAMTCLFRVMTNTFLGGSFIFTAVVALPLVVLLLLKFCLPSLSSLTPMDILQGVASEFSIPSIWGTVGREKSRNIQLGFAIYYLLVNTSILIAIIWDPITVVKAILSHHDVIKYNFPIVRPVAITTLVCGWISFPLYLYQIYWAECWDKLQVLATV